MLTLLMMTGSFCTIDRFTKFTVLSIMVISVKVNYKLNGH